MGATKFKDYFGNATRQFKSTSRVVNLGKNDNELSLYEQLKKHGTDDEKKAIRRMEEKQSDAAALKNLRNETRIDFDKGPEIDPYK